MKDKKTTVINEWINTNPDTSKTGIDPVFHQRGNMRDLVLFDKIRKKIKDKK